MRLKHILPYAQLTLPLSASPLNQTWDYIVVGSGAAGIPLADRLSESGKSVLLIERGWASSGRWGGTRRPAWLEGTNLTRFDVPALYQYIWADHPEENAGILCPDIAMTASCVLGGGTAVNAGQFYKPTRADWDLHMPPGFQSQDMRSATHKAFTRLPWTEHPSQDGKSYITNGTQIVIDALTNSSLQEPYREIHANEHPDDKNRTLSLPEYFLLNGERGGPMATYLVSASRRPNFRLQMNTTVKRVTRTGEQMSGVEVEASGPGGVRGVINVTPYTGRVILSAGVFGTSKILFRSGIGPRDQLEVVQKSDDGPTMLGEKYWLDLPVGKDLDDAPALYLAVKKDDVGSYDWESAYHNPNPVNKEQYLEHRSGPLSMIQPSMGPAFWDTITGSDNHSRVIQWTVNSGYTEGFGGMILFASNLNNGKTARGRLTIDKNLFVNASTLPYFNDEGNHDFQALVSSANSVLEVMKSIPNSSVYFPPLGTSMEDYLLGSIRTQSILSSNHWTASTHMGETCGDSRAVVDATTKVCGTKNLHVVDAGIVNGVPASNPQAAIIVAAERAAEVILELDGVRTYA